MGHCSVWEPARSAPQPPRSRDEPCEPAAGAGALGAAEASSAEGCAPRGRRAKGLSLSLPAPPRSAGWPSAEGGRRARRPPAPAGGAGPGRDRRGRPRPGCFFTASPHRSREQPGSDGEPGTRNVRSLRQTRGPEREGPCPPGRQKVAGLSAPYSSLKTANSCTAQGAPAVPPQGVADEGLRDTCDRELPHRTRCLGRRPRPLTLG